MEKCKFSNKSEISDKEIVCHVVLVLVSNVLSMLEAFCVL